MAMSAESVIYKDDDIEVSKSHVVIAGTDYLTANIRSVAIVKNYATGLLLMLIGAVVLIAGLALFRGTGWELRVLLFVGALGILFGFYSLRYSMMFHTNTGEVLAYASPNRTYMQKLVQAVNEALVARNGN